MADLSHEELVEAIKAFDKVHELFQSLDPAAGSEAHEAILRLGVHLLGMETAMLGETTEEIYTLRALVSTYVDLPIGYQLPMQQTYASLIQQTREALACESLSANRAPCEEVAFEQLGIRSYVATPVWTGEALFGTLCFSSRQARDRISLAKVLLLKMIGQALGGFLYRESLDRLRDEQMAQLRAAKAAAEELAEAKSLFLANMSHEIRTPMNAVIGMTSLLADRQLDAQSLEFVETIRSSGEHLLSLINDILDFSKIEAGKLDLEETRFSPTECVEECIDLVALSASRKGLEVATFVDPQVPSDVVGDPGRTRQVLVNLLSNAVKFTESGEVSVQVETLDRRDGRATLQLSVRDTGIGIPEERLDRLFKSFSQVDASTTRQYGGTGLGLVVSKRLCELMGGSIWVESSHRGSTFRFTIDVELAPAKERSSQDVRAQLAGLRVLIVDDNATNRRILSLRTEGWGMHPIETASAVEALAMLAAGEHFDLALLDFQMPGMDGVGLAHEIGALGFAPQMPRILMSSMGTGKAEARQRGVEFDAFVAKPIKVSVLLDAIGEVLGAERARANANSTVNYDEQLSRRYPLRILLAEDNPVNQDVATHMFTKLGYRTDVAADGREAIEALERQPYDLVFMDMQMPRMDGLEAARQICAQFAPDTRPRIVAMTANAMAGDRARCMEAGMDDYVSKPVRVEDLAKALISAHDARQARARDGAGPSATKSRQ